MTLDLRSKELEFRSNFGSAMFGGKGPECYRHDVDKRDLGLGWLLYAFTRVVRPATILEIGSGGSSFCLLAALKTNKFGHLYTVDPFEWGPVKDDGRTVPHAMFLNEVDKFGFSAYVTFFHAKSETLFRSWSTTIDLLVVDGDHSRDGVHNEWTYFSPWLSVGGYAFFHDPVALPGQIGSLVDRIENSEEFSCLVEPDYLGMIIAQRKFKINDDEHKQVQTLGDGTLTDARGKVTLLKQRFNQPFEGEDH